MSGIEGSTDARRTWPRGPYLTPNGLLYDPKGLAIRAIPFGPMGANHKLVRKRPLLRDSIM
jgi:hypothetical protein